MPTPIEHLFATFWDVYPRRVGKLAARKSYERALRDGALPEDIIRGVEAYKTNIIQEQTAERYVAHPSTWLNQGRWEDVHGLNLPQVETLSREESTRRARLEGYYKNGFWKQEWGDRPPPREVRYLSAG